MSDSVATAKGSGDRALRVLCKRRCVGWCGRMLPVCGAHNEENREKAENSGREPKPFGVGLGKNKVQLGHREQERESERESKWVPMQVSGKKWTQWTEKGIHPTSTLQRKAGQRTGSGRALLVCARQLPGRGSAEGIGL